MSRPLVRTVAAGVAIAVALGVSVAGRIAHRTDKAANLLTDYVGYYGAVGGWPIVQIVNVDGWDMLGIFDRGYILCGILRPIAGGLSAGQPTSDFLRSPADPSGVNVRLMPDKSTIELDMVGRRGVRYPRRPVLPRIEQLLELDGKSSHLTNGAPSFLQHVQLLRLSLTGFE